MSGNNFLTKHVLRRRVSEHRPYGEDSRNNDSSSSSSSDGESGRQDTRQNTCMYFDCMYVLPFVRAAWYLWYAFLQSSDFRQGNLHVTSLQNFWSLGVDCIALRTPAARAAGWSGFERRGACSIWNVGCVVMVCFLCNNCPAPSFF